ncbi:celI [Scenedesmus sp. PABB004]|nr:celI [Scenedesmus sp. PABB004]
MAPRASALALLVLCVSAVRLSAAQEDDYASILGMSYTFYEGQMSGVLPAWNQLLYSKPGGWKKPAHLDDGKDIGKDLSGGYYDAGDYLKISHPLAWGTANLVFSMLEFRSAYEAAGQWDIALRDIEWAADWLIKAHITASDDPAANVFVGQLSGKNDHQYFGRPEHATNARPVYIADTTTGGADLVGEFAAAYAAAAVLFKSVGRGAYAATLYKHAKQAFAFAEAHPNTWKVPPGVFQAYASYWPDGYIAHLAWAAGWMCKYDASACPSASKWFDTAMGVNNLRYGLGYDWDSVMPGAAALAVSLGLPQAAAAKTYLEGYILAKWEDVNNKCPAPSYSTVCYTPKGMAYYSDWGTLRNNGNMMFIAALMGKYGDSRQAHICWVRSQMRVITGASTGRSFLIGYGPNQPQRPHHRQSACSAKYSEPCTPFNGGTCCAGEQGTGPGGCCDESNFMASHPAQIVLRGGLVGGPDQSDNYPDIRNDYRQSEVAFDYNAGFTGAAAGLGSCCAAGTICKRDNPYFWMCVPGTKSLAALAMASPFSGGGASPAAVVAAGSVDALSVAAPPSAPAGAPLPVAATFMRAGEPVAGAEVEFAVSASADGAPSATVRAVTGADGVARAELPAEAAGAPGSSSLVSAITADGKAVGVKGTIAVSALDVPVAWEPPRRGSGRPQERRARVVVPPVIQEDFAVPEQGWMWEAGKGGAAATQASLKAANIKAKKSLGQNFCTDDAVLSDIVTAARVGAGDAVIEVGPGTGNLTRHLLAAAGRVVAVEKDDTLVERLREEFAAVRGATRRGVCAVPAAPGACRALRAPTGRAAAARRPLQAPNLQLVHGDVMRLDLAALVASMAAAAPARAPDAPAGADGVGAPPPPPQQQQRRRGAGGGVKVVANLPYNITKDFLLALLPQGSTVGELSVMIQQEVAERLCDATPGRPDYRAMSVLTHFYSRPLYRFRIPKEKYFPVPGVDGALVTFKLLPPARRVPVANERGFVALVNKGFSERRKMLRNTLQSLHSAAAVEAALVAAGVRPDARAQELDVQQFAALYNNLTAAAAAAGAEAAAGGEQASGAAERRRADASRPSDAAFTRHTEQPSAVRRPGGRGAMAASALLAALLLAGAKHGSSGQGFEPSSSVSRRKSAPELSGAPGDGRPPPLLADAPRPARRAGAAALASAQATGSVCPPGFNFFPGAAPDGSLPAAWTRTAQQEAGNTRSDALWTIALTSTRNLPGIDANATAPRLQLAPVHDLLTLGASPSRACQGLGAAAARADAAIAATAAGEGASTASRRLQGAAVVTSPARFRISYSLNRTGPVTELGEFKSAVPAPAINLTELAGLPDVCFLQLDAVSASADIVFRSCGDPLTINVTGMGPAPVPLYPGASEPLYRIVFHLVSDLNRTASGAWPEGEPPRLDQWVVLDSAAQAARPLVITPPSDLPDGWWNVRLSSGLATAHPSLISLGVAGIDRYTEEDAPEEVRGQLKFLPTNHWPSGKLLCFLDGLRYYNDADFTCRPPVSLVLGDAKNHTLTVMLEDVCAVNRTMEAAYGTWGYRLTKAPQSSAAAVDLGDYGGAGAVLEAGTGATGGTRVVRAASPSGAGAAARPRGGWAALAAGAAALAAGAAALA